MDIEKEHVPKVKLETNFVEFVTNLKRCLEFHYDIRETSSGHNLEDRLREDFYDSLYVEREEFEQLKVYVASGSCSIISGLPGTGKSTILMKLWHELSWDDSRYVLYIDLPQAAARLEELRKNGSSAPVCGWTFERLSRATLTDRRKILEFYSYRIRHDTRYESLRQEIIVRYSPKSDEDWIELFDHESVMDQYLERSFVSDDQDLLLLLHFLRDSWAKSVTIILDNIDTFPLGVQTEVVDKSVNLLSGDCLPIIAVRSSNLRRIEDNGGAQMTYSHVRMDTKYEAIARKKATLADEQVPVIINIETAKKFIDLRLSFLKREYERNGAWNAQIAAEVEEFRSALDRIFEMPYSSSILAVLDSWCNHSLRQLGIAISEIALSLAKEESNRTRVMRNKVYKFLCCGVGRQYYISDAGAINVFEPGIKGCRLPFPILTLLAYIGASRVYEGEHAHHKAVRFRDIRETFAEVGLGAVDLARYVNRIVEPPLLGGVPIAAAHTRSKSVEISPIADGYEVPQHQDDKIIELLPRGEYLVHQFIHSVEYLFWMAVELDKNESKIHDINNVSDAAKFVIAAEFVKNFVWPAVKEVDQNVLRDSPRLANVLGHNYKTLGKGFVRRSAESIRAFGTAIDLDLFQRSNVGQLEPNEGKEVALEKGLYERGLKSLNWVRKNVR